MDKKAGLTADVEGEDSAHPSAAHPMPQSGPPNLDDASRKIMEVLLRQSAMDHWRAYQLSRPKNGVHLWRVIHCYTSANLPLPDDVYQLVQELAKRVVAAKNPMEVQQALMLKGKRGVPLGPVGADADARKHWTASSYYQFRHGSRTPFGRRLAVQEINERVAKEQKTTPAQVKNIARELGLTKKRRK